MHKEHFKDTLLAALAYKPYQPVLVTGVVGSGKSNLVVETCKAHNDKINLYPIIGHDDIDFKLQFRKLFLDKDVDSIIQKATENPDKIIMLFFDDADRMPNNTLSELLFIATTRQYRNANDELIELPDNVDILLTFTETADRTAKDVIDAACLDKFYMLHVDL